MIYLPIKSKANSLNRKAGTKKTYLRQGLEYQLYNSISTVIRNDSVCLPFEIASNSSR